MFDMTPHEIYVFILCVIVYVALTATFTVMIVYILRLLLKLIRGGHEDEKILEDYKQTKGKKVKKKAADFADRIFTAAICLVMFFAFGFSVYMQTYANNVNTDIPLYRVVLSDSMSQKYEKNEYLFENDLNDQFQRFDLVLTHKLPDEFDLKLYDIVVYEVDEQLVIHRIIGIEEPNASHPNERHFRLQGDNVHVADKFPVKYSQMKAIYKGQRIPFLGSFVSFMQSPAGYICILLILFGIFAIPWMDRKLEEEEKLRLQTLLDEEETKKPTKDEIARGAMCAHGKSRRDCPYCSLGDYFPIHMRFKLDYPTEKSEAYDEYNGYPIETAVVVEKDEVPSKKKGKNKKEKKKN